MLQRCAVACAPPRARRRSMQEAAATRTAPKKVRAEALPSYVNPYDPESPAGAELAQRHGVEEVLQKRAMAHTIHKQRTSILSDRYDIEGCVPRIAQGNVLTDLSTLEHQATTASSLEEIMYSIGWAVQLHFYQDDAASVHVATAFDGFGDADPVAPVRWKLEWSGVKPTAISDGYNSILVGKVPGYTCVWNWDGSGVSTMKGSRFRVSIKGVTVPTTKEIIPATLVGQLLALYPDAD